MVEGLQDFVPEEGTACLLRQERVEMDRKGKRKEGRREREREKRCTPA